MTPVGSKPVQTYAALSNQVDKTKATTSSELTSTNVEASALKAEQNKVTLSAEGKALLAALEQIDHESKKIEAENKTVSEKVEIICPRRAGNGSSRHHRRGRGQLLLCWPIPLRSHDRWRHSTGTCLKIVLHKFKQGFLSLRQLYSFEPFFHLTP